MSEQFEPHAEMSPELVLSEAETRRLVEQIEAGIKATEKLERAIATRPQPSAEPVAWMYTKEGALDEYGQPKVILLDYDTPAAVADGWTETPLYPASALEAARREALEQAAALVDQLNREGPYLAIGAAEHIRALKENPNAG